MARQFASDAGRSIAVLIEVVDRANVVESTACDVVPARCVSAGHDP